MFTGKDRLSGMQIARKLDMTPKVVYRLIQRIKRHGSLVPRKRGTREKVSK